MKIGYIVPSWSSNPIASGIVTYVRQITQGTEGRQSVIIPFSIDHQNHNQAISVVPPPGLSFSNAWLRLRRRLQKTPDANTVVFIDTLSRQVAMAQKRFGVEVVEMEETFGLAQRLQQKVDIPVAIRLHGPWFLTGVANGVAQDEPFQERVRAEGAAITSAPFVTSPSEYALAEARRAYGHAIQQARVIVNPGIRPTQYPSWSTDTHDGRTLLFIGRMDLLKGADVLLRAFQILHSRIPEASLIMVGPDSGIAAENQLLGFEEYCSYLGLSASARSQIQYRGPLAIDSIWQLRCRTTLSIVASRYETFPYAALESLLTGAPTVFSNVGGIPEILTHDLTGRAFQSGDPSSLAQELEYCLRNPDRMLEFSRNALNESVQFEPNRVFQQFQNYYSQNDAH